MKDKTMSLAEVVSQIRDGDSILIGGWGPTRKPMTVIKEIARSNLKDLTVMSLAGIDLDLLIGAGKVKKAVYGFVSLEGVPGNPGNFKRVRKEGSIETMELSEGMFVAGFKAAAERLPFYPTRSGLGSDILTVNPGIKTFEDPYNGEKLVAMPALVPDVALLHVNAADTRGNGQIIGNPFIDRIFVRAAKKVFLSAEKIVPEKQLTDYQTVEILSPWVTGVVETPKGAHPGICYPDYGCDEAHLAEYGKSTADEESFKAYLKKYVL